MTAGAFGVRSAQAAINLVTGVSGTGLGVAQSERVPERARVVLGHVLVILGEPELRFGHALAREPIPDLDDNQPLLAAPGVHREG